MRPYLRPSSPLPFVPAKLELQAQVIKHFECQFSVLILTYRLGQPSKCMLQFD